ncbi:uncharacterized protein B0H18DRAFT_878205, partial [Fomitopsis serialis]|uniref:uncharacterized protein n=1 Tax=Fomitopsis serialis TaxID=139415 RepID=UPI002008B182
TNRILHEAMDIITASLKEAARKGKEMADGFGNVRLVFPPVVAMSGDLLEQLSMAAVSPSASPMSIARTKQFGDGVQHPRRTKAHTLQGLSGVHKPWWRDYPLTDPSLFCVPDLLHSDYKFFWDHILKACLIHVGPAELDRRFDARHKRIGYAGLRRVSDAKQMTGRMHREIMRSTVVAIQGAVTPGFMRAIRAIMEFLLAAQRPRHTPSSLAHMATNLRDFHDSKQAIADEGGRGTLDHWHIPKLELLSNFIPAIISHGTLPQWSCDAVEHLLRTEAKKPFNMFTSRRRSDYGQQCARHLDRVEKMRMFEIYSLFKANGASLHNTFPDDAMMDDVDIHNAASVGVARTWVANALPGTGAERCIRGPRAPRNLFATGSLVPDNSNVAFHLTKKPSATHSIGEIPTIYQLPDFRAAVADYVQGFDMDSRQGAIRWSLNSYDAGFDDVHVWNTYRIQLLSVYDEAARLEPETLRAMPPDATYPWGMCDAVLVDSLTADGQPRQNGSLIAQVRIVFEPIPRKGRVLPAWLQTPLVYIQDFVFADLDEHGLPCKTADILMYKVQRRRYVDAWGAVQRAGEVVPLRNIARPVDLAPVHGGPVMHASLTEYNALEIPESYWLNDLWDDELHAVLTGEYE